MLKIQVLQEDIANAIKHYVSAIVSNCCPVSFAINRTLNLPFGHVSVSHFGIANVNGMKYMVDEDGLDLLDEFDARGVIEPIIITLNPI